MIVKFIKGVRTFGRLFVKGFTVQGVLVPFIIEVVGLIIAITGVITHAKPALLIGWGLYFGGLFYGINFTRRETRKATQVMDAQISQLEQVLAGLQALPDDDPLKNPPAVSKEMIEEINEAMNPSKKFYNVEEDGL